ncbi:MAG: hypothetical protein K2X93_22005 [Candidatus Obscuribacterales bacterium]|nr:hypothetical protein [Candidatus Obscuribacterales bacterium]
MSDDAPIVEVKVLLDHKDKGSYPGRIFIKKPYEKNGHWLCPVGVDGLGALPEIGGGTAIQSLCLAISALEFRLKLYIEREGKIYLNEGVNRGRPIDLQSMFPKT